MSSTTAVPVVLVSVQVNHKEGEDGENHSHCDVTRYVGIAGEERDETKYIIKKYEEEHCHKVWQELVCLFAEVGVDNIVPYIEENWFEERLHAFRATGVLLVCLCEADEYY